MDQETSIILERLNEKLTGVMPYKLYLATIDEIDYLEKNARFMTKEQFASLANNVKKDSALSSVPLVYRKPEDGRLLVVSGNHRIKAAHEAGLTSFLVLLIDKVLTREELVAIQLSHNAIAGQDDEQILKELYDELKDVEAILYAGFTSEQIQKLQSADFSAIKEEPLHYESINLLFLPGEIERMKAIFNRVIDNSVNKEIFVGRISEYDSILQGLIAAKEGQNIINSTLAFFALAQVADEYLAGKTDDLQEAFEEGLEDTVSFILGGTRKRISKKTAKLLRKALKEKMDSGLNLDDALAALSK